MTSRVRTLLGRNIRQLRKRHGWSQMELGEIANLHFTYISGTELGKRNIAIESIVKIARALRVTPSKLLEGIR